MTATGRVSNVEWILMCTAGDTNYLDALPRLTDDELRHCLGHERRKTSLNYLRREARRRGMEVPSDGARKAAT